MESTANRSNHSLALLLQEVLTAVVRLRSNSQTVSDADGFRRQLVSSLRNAEQEGMSHGYSGSEMRLAIFAVVAFIDESVLNSRNPIFSSWPRKPVQEELFGGFVAGETFFANIQGLLQASDSSNVAGVLEVYQLCLLLGYQGRYTLGNRGELSSIVKKIADKIDRIWGVGEFSPGWAPVSGTIPIIPQKGGVTGLLYATIASAVLALLLFVGFSYLLDSGVKAVHDMAGQALAVTR